MVEFDNADEVYRATLSCYTTTAVVDYLKKTVLPHLDDEKTLYDVFKNQIELLHSHEGVFYVSEAMSWDAGYSCLDHSFQNETLWKLTFEGKCKNSDMCNDLADKFAELKNTLDDVFNSDTSVLSNLYIQTWKKNGSRNKKQWEMKLR